jgi:hypothetical protein
MDGGFASGSWEGRPPCRPVPMREKLTRLTAHRESWIFILFLNCWRSTRSSTLPNRIAQPPQDRGINPLATVFASSSWEGRPPCHPLSAPLCFLSASKPCQSGHHSGCFSRTDGLSYAIEKSVGVIQLDTRRRGLGWGGVRGET